MRRKARRTHRRRGATRRVIRRRRGGGRAFSRPLHPSAKLASVIGSGSVSRPQATKRIWAYIKQHRLQDAKERRMINADAKLHGLFGAGRISMLKLPGIMARNLSAN